MLSLTLGTAALSGVSCVDLDPRGEPTMTWWSALHESIEVLVDFPAVIATDLCHNIDKYFENKPIHEFTEYESIFQLQPNDQQCLLLFVTHNSFDSCWSGASNGAAIQFWQRPRRQ
jgi:hypothetical protein